MWRRADLNLPGQSDGCNSPLLRKAYRFIFLYRMRERRTMTPTLLASIMPHAPKERCSTFLPFMLEAMAEFHINTPLRQAAFLAQIAHESGELRWMEEIWGPTQQQACYEPPSPVARMLGNFKSGDGHRFKGRGPIQITGRYNYRKFGRLLCLDLEGQPRMVAKPEVGFRVAGAYWSTNGLNELADVEDIHGITKRINGGFNGLAERQSYYRRGYTLLCTDIRAAIPIPRPEDGSCTDS